MEEAGLLDRPPVTKPKTKRGTGLVAISVKGSAHICNISMQVCILTSVFVCLHVLPAMCVCVSAIHVCLCMSKFGSNAKLDPSEKNKAQKITFQVVMSIWEVPSPHSSFPWRSLCAMGA